MWLFPCTGGIQFVSAEPGFVQDFRLAFNLAGVPPLEPVMAGVEPEVGTTVHGTLVKLSRSVRLSHPCRKYSLSWQGAGHLGSTGGF
jgi:hypothetical protein